MANGLTAYRRSIEGTPAVKSKKKQVAELEKRLKTKKRELSTARKKAGLAYKRKTKTKAITKKKRR